MKTLALWVSMAAAAVAQDRGTEFRVNQLKQQLGLSDEQSAKVKEILDKDAEQIRALLTDEQKTKYDELRQRGGAGGGNRQGGFQFGGQGGRQFGGGLQMDQLKTELNLTDEQVEKIKPVVEEFQAQTQKRMEELRQGGFQNLDWQAELAKGQETMKAFSEKIKAHLSDEQKTKADALMERATGWMRMIPNVLQRFQGGGAAAGTATRASVDERVKKAVDALKIEKDDERTAVRELIEKAIKARDALDDYLKSSRDSLGAAAGNKELSNEALKDKLTDYDKERKRLEKALKDAQDTLAEVVDSRQEMELIRQNVL